MEVRDLTYYFVLAENDFALGTSRVSGKEVVKIVLYLDRIDE